MNTKKQRAVLGLKPKAISNSILIFTKVYLDFSWNSHVAKTKFVLIGRIT